MECNRLEHLPVKIGRLIFGMVDTPSLCRLYIAYQGWAYVNEIKDVLDERQVEVTPEVVITGDTTKIDFDTLSKLPPIDISLKTTEPYMGLTLGHLRQNRFKLVALSIDGSALADKRKLKYDLKFLGTTLSELHLLHTPFTTERIPSYITKLRLCSWKYRGVLNLTNLFYLTHFESHKCEFEKGVQLPVLIIYLDYSQSRPPLCILDLPNLQHCRGEVTAIPWSQLRSVETSVLPFYEAVLQMESIIIHGHDFLFVRYFCPKLINVELTYDPDLGGHIFRDVTLVFNRTQLAQLEVLKGYGFMVTNVSMALLHNVKVLHCYVNETVTAAFPLPPQLEEWKIWTSEQVSNIPSRLKSFSCYGSQHVVIRSVALKKLQIKKAIIVSIECVNLTELCLRGCKTLLTIGAPNLLKLVYQSTGMLPAGYLFPKLMDLDMSLLLQCLVVKNHLRSITLTSMNLSRLSISADFVSLNQCVIPEDTEINAIVLKCRSSRNGKKSALLGTRNIKCRELDCVKIEHIPEMVEKLTYNPVGDIMSKRRLATGVAEAIQNKCKRLKSLSIKRSVEMFVDGQNTFRMPPSVRQVKLDGNSALKNLNIQSEQKLEHFECSRLVSQQPATFNRTPSGLRAPQNTLASSLSRRW